MIFTPGQYKLKINPQKLYFKAYLTQVGIIKALRFLNRCVDIVVLIVTHFWRRNDNKYMLQGMPQAPRKWQVIDETGILKGDYYEGLSESSVLSLALINPYRLGNLYIQISNILTLAIRNNIGIVYLPTEIANVQIPNIKNVKVNYINTNILIGNQIKSNFFYSEIFFDNKMLQCRKEIFKSLSIANYSFEYFEENSVAVHIRSGDIFKDFPGNPNYSQPPKSFYYKVLQKYLNQKIYIVTEDENSPVLQPLLCWLNNLNVNYCLVGKDLREATHTLNKCKTLILSRGTFILPFLNCTTERKLHIYGKLGVGSRFLDLYGDNKIEICEYSDSDAKMFDSYWVNCYFGRRLLEGL